MKERPILFSGPMVRAILAGRKTQTRRIVRKGAALGRIHDLETSGEATMLVGHLCPYGEPGGRLWVRETWYDDLSNGTCARTRDTLDGIYYRADGEATAQGLDNDQPVPWRPSIFMPRAACRIVLEIEAVRVERIQDITREDIRREGVQPDLALNGININGPRAYHRAFRRGWDALNAARGGGWSVNPWVWVISFRRVV